MGNKNIFTVLTLLILSSVFINLCIGTKICQRHIGGLVPQLIEDRNNVSGLGEFPWTVGIVQDNIVFCAGSLIHPNVILTAAHCLKGIQKNKITVKAGLWDIGKENENDKYPVQERVVAEIVTHNDYSAVDKKYINDIAIIFVKTPFELTEHINIICLPQNETIIPNICFSTGWNMPKGEAATKPIVAITQPRKYALPLIPIDVCEKKFKESELGSTFSLNINSICAGGEKVIDSFCVGDGGSFLACPFDAKPDPSYILTGITSWGLECSKELPGTYTKIFNYIQWIHGELEKKGFNSTSVIPAEK